MKSVCILITFSFVAVFLGAWTWFTVLPREQLADLKDQPQRPVGLVDDDAPVSLNELFKMYCELGLPLPPAEAPLVTFDSGRRTHNGKEENWQAIAFLLRGGTKERPPLLLVGTQEYEGDQKNVVPVEPKTALGKEIAAKRGSCVFGINAGLAIALQCHARGWDELAGVLWRKSLGESAGHHNSIFYQPADLPPRTALRHMAWTHWGNELVKAKTDRAAIAKRMTVLIKSDARLATEGNKMLLHSLKLALVPSTAKPGSADALIDDLVDLCYKQKSDPRCQRLVELGFAAVPALIEHLDDRRLTRTVSISFNNFAPYPLQVGEIVSNLVQALAGDALGKDWVRRLQGDTVNELDARAWWEQAQKVGEEAYMARYVLPEGKNKKLSNQVILEVITKKYPRQLLTIYRKLLDKRPYMDSSQVANALANSSLSVQRKKELYLYAAANQDLEHRRHALHHLRNLDDQQFAKLLIGTLESMPTTPKDPYWMTESYILQLVLLTEDRHVWQALAETAKRAEVGLRMQFIASMYGEKMRKQQLRFLATFLTDETAGTSGRTFPVLAVRDMAAKQIAWILKLDVEPNAEWSKEQWENLREQAREALKRETK